MRVTPIVAVMIAVSGLWLAARFKGYENVTSVSAAAPDSFAIAAINSDRSSFSPLRNDICDDVISESLSGIETKRNRIPRASMSEKCGEYQTHGRVDGDE